MSFPAYPAYRDSGVAWLRSVPAHWRQLPARRLFGQRREPASPGDEQLSATQRYGVVPQRLFMEATDQKVVLALSGTDNFKHVEYDDFVISLRSFQGGIERSRYRGCVSPAYTVLRPSPSLVPAFWAYLLKSGSFIGALQSVIEGIRDGKTIAYEQFGGVILPIPEADEQLAIAAFLDRECGKIDALVAEQERLIALVVERQQRVIYVAVTQGVEPARTTQRSGLAVPEFVPEDWEVLPLTRVVRQFVDYRGSTPTKVDAGVPLITAAQIKDGKIDHSLDPVFITEAEYNVRMTRGLPTRGDVLLTTEAPLGEVAQIEDERVAPGQRMILLKVDDAKMSSDYLYWHFRSEFGRKELWTRASGSTASGIRADRLRGSPVLVPPLEEQKRIVRFIRDELGKFDGIERELSRQIALLKERRAALISAAVTGKIDVRGVVAPAEAKAA